MFSCTALLTKPNAINGYLFPAVGRLLSFYGIFAANARTCATSSTASSLHFPGAPRGIAIST